MNQFQYAIVNWSLNFIVDLLSFYLISLSCSFFSFLFFFLCLFSFVPFKISRYSWLSCLLIFFGLQHFLRLSLFLMTLTVLKSTSQVFYRIHSIGIYVIFFFMVRQELWLWGERSQVKFQTHPHNKSTICYHYDSSLLMVTLISWPKQCLPDFSNFPPFSILYSLEGGCYL